MIPITYIAGFIKDADAAFRELWTELNWVRHDKVPRSEYYCNLWEVPYTYGSQAYARTYEAQPWHDRITAILADLENHTKTSFEVCFLNRYETGGDQLGWHADDSPEMDDTRPIAIITLLPPGGGEREIWFRANGSSEIERVRLAHGSLCLMAPGMQDTHQHRVPKADRQDAGPRISLTFRGYFKNLLGDRHD